MLNNIEQTPKKISSNKKHHVLLSLEQKEMKEQLKEQNTTYSFLQKRQQIRKIRMELPIYQKKDEIIATIRENQIVMIIGETGSGKTTQIVQY
jgi:HrpA-like RNA helicase